MQQDWGHAIVGAFQALIPQPKYCACINQIVGLVQPPVDPIAERSEWPAPLTGRTGRRVVGGGVAKLLNDRGQVVAELGPKPAILVASLPGVHAVEPPQYRPTERVRLLRNSGTDDRRHRDWEVVEAREPVKLDTKPSGGVGEARQTDHELGTQPIQRVVGAGVPQRGERQPGQIRKLSSQQCLNDFGAGVGLVGM